MTYTTNPENTLINIANWCTQWQGNINQCIADVYNSPATAQIINNWHAVEGLL